MDNNIIEEVQVGEDIMEVEEVPAVQFDLVIPVVEQTERWSNEKLKLYQMNHSLFRSLLIKHYAIRYRKGKIAWPSRISQFQKSLLPLIDGGTYLDNRDIIRNNNRIRNLPKIDHTSFNNTLRKGLSKLYRKNRTGEWERLGFGLFTLQDIPSKTKVFY